MDNAGPRQMPLDNRSMSRAGWARKTAGSGRVSGAVAHLSKRRRGVQRGTRSPTGLQMLCTGDHRHTVGWQKHLPPCPLFGGVQYESHSRGETNKRSIDGRHTATSGNYPAQSRPVVRRSLVSILGSREIPFPGSRKKIETLESR